MEEEVTVQSDCTLDTDEDTSLSGQIDDNDVRLEDDTAKSMLPNFNNNDDEALSDEERMLLYEKAMQFKRLGNLNHALISFLGCLQGLQPSCKSKFTMLPQCLTHIAEIYAYLEDFQKATEFMQAAKLYYEIAIIEAGIQVDGYKKEAETPYRPLDLDPCLDEAKRANEYEKLSYSCLHHQKFQLALDYCGKATKLRQQVYGDEHPITSKSLDLFTLIYAEMGKYQYGEALQKYGDLNKIINEEEKKDDTSEPVTLTADETTTEADEKPVEVEPVVSIVVTPSFEDTKTDNNVNDEEEKLVENIPEVRQLVEDIQTEEQPRKEVRFEGVDKTDDVTEESISLLTPCQFLVIFFLSAFLAVFITGVWCMVSESTSCPSRHYIYATLKYWYYVYFVPPAVDDKFY